MMAMSWSTVRVTIVKLRALHGLIRAELSNMVVGVTKGYEQSWKSPVWAIRPKFKDGRLSFNVGYINPVCTRFRLVST